MSEQYKILADLSNKKREEEDRIENAYAITTHKTQGDTLDKGIVNLGKTEKKFRLYICAAFTF